MPIADLVEKVIPTILSGAAITRAYDLSEVLAGQIDIKRQANVLDLSEMLQKPLKNATYLPSK